MFDADGSIHNHIHDDIHNAEKRLKDIKGKMQIVEAILELAGEHDLKPETRAIAEITRKVSNMEIVQAEDRLVFLKRLHDEYFPAGIKMDHGH